MESKDANAADPKPKYSLADWIAAAVLGAASAVLYFASMADYAFPGAGAHLTAVWSGLDPSAVALYPLMKPFASLFGYGNALAPVCGTVAVVALYFIVLAFTRVRSGENAHLPEVRLVTRIGAIAAAVVFMLTPAVREASTHLEPRAFDAAWALVSILLLIPYARVPGAVAWLFPILVGVMAAMGVADSPLPIALLPIYIVAVWGASRSRGGRGYGAAIAFVLVFVIAAAIFVPSVVDDFGEFSDALKDAFEIYLDPKSRLVALFATVPFVCALMASGRALGERATGLSQWMFHGWVTLFCVLAVATPLSPSFLMRELGVLPVIASAFAAFVAGYVAVYWLVCATVAPNINESLVADSKSAITGSRIVAYVFGGFFALVIAISAVIHLFSFHGDAGAFADKVAERILADLGDRSWFVTDGTLDDHLRLAAAKQGRELNLVCLQRDLDKKYLDDLKKLVAEKKLGGGRNNELVSVSLSLGVLTFVQDWFAADPAAAKSVAVFGAPDLWYAADVKPVPELLFFGSDPARAADWSAWDEFDALLAAPKGWGSYGIRDVTDPVERLRLGLRRHMGLVANDRGVWLQDAGADDDAFAMYELVLGEIDSDNVCALFNEFEMARAGHKKAASKKVELERRLKAIQDDADRRYYLWSLANYYGYIRSAEVFVRLGCTWARSGLPGEALHQIRRAIDFVPSESRTALVNMMAALYASGHDQRKSREMFESVLSRDPENHDALVGLMRLSLMDGDLDAAKAFLEKAVAVAGDDPRAQVEVALLHMMKGDLASAKDVLIRMTDADRGNLEAWSLVAATTIQQIDASSDPAERRKLSKYLDDVVLATMEKHATSASDYHLQTTRAFALMRREGDNRKEARDAFAAAARERPDIAATSDIVLGLDISLNDTEDAERQAREVLRRNRKAPLANYVMGSLALQNGRYVEAETFLRRAADAPKPIPLALNDLAEVLRRDGNFTEAEKYARRAVAVAPRLYVAWETLGSTLLDAGRGLDEAESCIKKACELSKGEDGRESDPRMLISLARVQFKRGDMTAGKTTLRKVRARMDELSDFDRQAFEELRKSAQ